MNNFLKDTEDKIKKYGYVVIFVFADVENQKPSFTYTVGLSKTYKHPELIVFGLPQEASKILLDNVVEKIIEDKGGVEVNKLYEEIANMPLQFLKVKNGAADEYAMNFFYHYPDVKLEMLQMIWPDPAGIFPTEDSYDPKYKIAQPLLV